MIVTAWVEERLGVCPETRLVAIDLGGERVHTYRDISVDLYKKAISLMEEADHVRCRCFGQRGLGQRTEMWFPDPALEHVMRKLGMLRGPPACGT